MRAARRRQSLPFGGGEKGEAIGHGPFKKKGQCPGREGRRRNAASRRMAKSLGGSLRKQRVILEKGCSGGENRVLRECCPEGISHGESMKRGIKRPTRKRTKVANAGEGSLKWGVSPEA